MQIKGQLRNEKGNIVPQARKFLKAKFLENKEDFISQCQEVNGNLELPVTNEEGDMVYIRLAVTISDKSLNEAPTPKSSSNSETPTYSFSCNE